MEPASAGVGDILAQWLRRDWSRFWSFLQSEQPAICRDISGETRPGTASF